VSTPSAVSDFAGSQSDRLRDALTRAAGLLAADGRQAGPASVQDGMGDLVPAPDAWGVTAALDEGTTVVAMLSGQAAAALGDPDAVISTLTSVLGVIATDLGVALGDISTFDRPEDLLTQLTTLPDPTGDGRTVIGAGIFEGDDVVATVGALVVAAGDEADDGGPVDGPSTPAPATAGAAVLERGLQLLADIELTVTAELGRARLAVGELLDLQPGAIIELDREAGVPIDVLVNGTLFARGEVVVVEDSFAVRVSEIVTDEDTP
jgi:flagellar motor switch protein FliN/FliY